MLPRHWVVPHDIRPAPAAAGHSRAGYFAPLHGSRSRDRGRARAGQTAPRTGCWTPERRRYHRRRGGGSSGKGLRRLAGDHPALGDRQAGRRRENSCCTRCFRGRGGLSAPSALLRTRDAASGASVSSIGRASQGGSPAADRRAMVPSNDDRAQRSSARHAE